jgi:6-phosphogluconate dehydrogenase
MQVAIVGLGRMGGNIAQHAVEKRHQVVGYDPSEDSRKKVAEAGADVAASLAELVKQLDAPRVILLYVPHGEVTEQVCRDLLGLVGPGDVVADCGNSHWMDSRRRHGMFAEKGIHFVDVGTSGGVDGARTGACFMAGGPKEAYAVLEPLLRDLALDELGAVHVSEEAGSGHFVKLIHNAIEFGMNQAIAEGVEMLMRSDYTLDLPRLFVNWNHGSVIRSWLVQLMGQQLETHLGEWDRLSTYVEDTQEVKWVLNWAMDQDIPSPVTGLAQQMLMQFRDLDWPAAKAHALLRNAYGGHPIRRVGDVPPRA